MMQSVLDVKGKSSSQCGRQFSCEDSLLHSFEVCRCDCLPTLHMCCLKRRTIKMYRIRIFYHGPMGPSTKLVLRKRNSVRSCKATSGCFYAIRCICRVHKNE